MKKFKVLWAETTYWETEFNAENKEDALKRFGSDTEALDNAKINSSDQIWGTEEAEEIKGD